MYRFTAQRQFSGEHCAAENCADTPEQCSRRDEEISAQRMRGIATGVCGIQDSATTSDEDAGSSNWSSSTGSNPTTTCATTSCAPGENITNVGVSRLP